MENDCVFCKIIANKIPAFKVYEDADFLAFFDIAQFTPGHTLVIPKQHVRFVWDVVNSAKYYEVINKIVAHYRSLGFKYVDGLCFGRDVAHAHFQIVPHDGNDIDWNNALKGLEYFHQVERAALTKEKAELLLKRFSLIDKHE